MATETPSVCSLMGAEKNILSTNCCSNLDEFFELDSDFDVTKSTGENYRSNSLEYYGSYASIRSKLDVNYHGNYTKKRQLFQDILIQDVIGAAIEKENPWIVFSAGAMGAGKSHVIKWMSYHGYFPLPDVIRIDPDEFKLGFPEWEAYVKHNPMKAGFMTRRESGYIVEIAQEAALQMRKNIWVDGSLRDSDWYRHVFAQIKSKYPHYSIAILFVYASPKTVLMRAQKRGDETGRYVPEEEILDSLRRVPKSIEKLNQFVDFVAYIMNEGEVPVLTDFCDREGHHSNNSGFEQVRIRFATLHQLQDTTHEREHVGKIISNPGIIVFSKTYCSYCSKVKALLKRLNLTFDLIELDQLTSGIALQFELSKLTGCHTVPQVFFEGRFIGGWEDITKLERSGKLHKKLGLTAKSANLIKEGENFLNYISVGVSNKNSASSCL